MLSLAQNATRDDSRDSEISQNSVKANIGSENKSQDTRNDQTVRIEQTSPEKITTLIAEKQFDSAARLLDQAIESDPHSAALHAIRPKLAFHFNFGREPEKGRIQNEQLIGYILANHDRNPELVPLLGPA